MIRSMREIPRPHFYGIQTNPEYGTGQASPQSLTVGGEEVPIPLDGLTQALFKAVRWTPSE